MSELISNGRINWRVFFEKQKRENNRSFMVANFGVDGSNNEKPRNLFKMDYEVIMSLAKEYGYQLSEFSSEKYKTFIQVKTK